MFIHNKRLQYTVRVGESNPVLGSLLLERFGGPDGELAAAVRHWPKGRWKRGVPSFAHRGRQQPHAADPVQGRPGTDQFFARAVDRGLRAASELRDADLLAGEDQVGVPDDLAVDLEDRVVLVGVALGRLSSRHRRGRSWRCPRIDGEPENGGSRPALRRATAYRPQEAIRKLAAQAVRLQRLSCRLSIPDGSRMLSMEIGGKPLASALTSRPDGRLEQVALSGGRKVGPARGHGAAKGRHDVIGSHSVTLSIATSRQETREPHVRPAATALSTLPAARDKIAKLAIG